MGKEKRFSFFQVGLDFIFVNLGLFHVGNANHDDVGPPDCLRNFDHLEPVPLGHTDRLASLVKTDDDLAAAFLEVQGMGVTLGTVTDYGERFLLDGRDLRLFLGVYFSGHGRFVLLVCDDDLV